MAPQIYIEDFISEYKASSMVREITSFLGAYLFSPFFLFASLVYYFLVPQKSIEMNYKKALVKSLRHFVKRSITLFSALVCLLLTSPLFLILPILIKLDSRGPVFYRQIRIGMNRRRKERRNRIFDDLNERRNGDRRNEKFYGRPFILYKFRTMFENAEIRTGPVWALQDDPRVTNVGKVLRAFHLDELPQLINILKGDMNFIGPRPERPNFVCKFATIIPQYNKRFLVKPGLTGWAQVYCGYDQSLEDVKKKLSYEIDYIENKNSLKYDLEILYKTAKYLLTKDRLVI